MRQTPTQPRPDGAQTEEEEAAPVADEHATDEQTEEAEQLAADKARRKKVSISPLFK